MAIVQSRPIVKRRLGGGGGQNTSRSWAATTAPP
jgi:hypothetical protein